MIKLLKPKFWERKNNILIPILFLPISLVIQMLFVLKKIFNTKEKFQIPIICVGNIYIGGTGKTPISIELLKILKKIYKKPVFIKKNYPDQIDEFLLLKQYGPVYKEDSRSIAIRNAVKAGAKIAILDDGFQDLSIHKNVNIICFNEKQWIGNGFTIPSGPLREKLTALKKVNCVIINGKRDRDKENYILNINNKIKIFYVNYIADKINRYKRKKIISFAGIGNPDNFFNLLKKNKLNVIEEFSFADHYKYTDRDLNKLLLNCKQKNAILLTTEKDYLRLPKKYKKKINFIKLKVKIINKEKFIKYIKKLI